MDLTTLQIAERIAEAAIDARINYMHKLATVWRRQSMAAPFDSTSVGSETPAQAVLRTLRENHVWLHRTVQDADGVIDGDAPTEVLPEAEA